MKSRYAALFALSVICLPTFGAPAAAQTAGAFPEREIRIIIGFPPGSSIELSLRALAQVASKYISKPLIIVNKPGASQAIALGELVRTTPDGYTIGVTTDGFRAVTRYQQATNFEPDDLRVLVGYARLRHILFVKGDSPYGNYDDYVKFGRTKENALDYGGTGQGTAPDLIGRVFFRDLGIKATYVPFRGTNELIPAILGNHLISGINDISVLLPQIENKALKAVMVYGNARLEELPDVPSSKEKNHSDINLFNSTVSVIAHKDIPADRLKYLEDAFRRAAEDPDFKKAAKDTGLQAVSIRPQEVEDGIVALKKMGIPLLKEMNLYVGP